MTGRHVTRYRLFVASPGDVAAERDRLAMVVENMNRSLRRRDVVLDLEDYRMTVVPSPGIDPQAVINEQVRDVDIFILILWSRLGTPTGRAASGTAEEYQRAFADWTACGRPRILPYFRTSDLPYHHDQKQFKEVRGFQERFAGLAHEYASVEQFERDVREHLQIIVDELHQRDIASTGADQAGFAPEDPVKLDLDLIGLRLELERRLTWLCNHLLGDGQPTFATIGSLEYDKYLTPEQAHVATRILTLDTGPLADRGQFLAAATRVAGSFRAIVFYAHVVKRLKHHGWKIRAPDDPEAVRPDLHISKGGSTARIVPRFALANDKRLVLRTLERLTPEPGTSIIVLPDDERVRTSAPSENPRIVRLEDLPTALGQIA